MTLEARKYQLIQKITHLEDEASVSRLEVVFKMLAEELDILNKVAKPMRKQLSIEELVEEQNYKGINKDKFKRLVQDMAIEEPLEELLAMI